jgi:HD-like signal output (HDOD) protein
MPTATLVEPQARVMDAVKKVSALATLPEVTAKIIATVEDPKSTATQLHKIVSHDPALVTRILKVVNSAFYGLPGQIGSVERAIVLLGLNAVKNIAVAASLGQLFRGAKLTDEFSAKDLWRHCIAVGVAARDLAKQMKLGTADEAFLSGMIHDIGLLISLQQTPDALRAVCERAATTGTDFCELERELIGMDHQQLGMALAENWKFPRTCQLVAGYHHRPGTLTDQSRVLVTLVYVADTICCSSPKHGFNLTALHQRLDDAGLLDMKLDRVLIERTAANLDNLVNVASSLLG